MTHKRNPLWHWEAFPVSGYNPDPMPRVEAWHHATPCEAPIINEYPYKPWDIHYNRNLDPAMIILDANQAIIDREYKRRVKWYARKRKV